MTESQYVTCLRTRFGGDDFVLLPQVRNTTGFARAKIRTADALAISLYPSRGIDVHGFEFKDSRSDWVKERDNPAKSDEIGRFCRYWWLVVSDEKIVSKGELPSAWGLLLATEDGVKTIQKAPPREVEPPTWLFVASVLRAAKDVVTDEDEVRRRIQKAVADATEGMYQRIETEKKRASATAKQELAELAGRVREFELASGVDIGANRWTGWGHEKPQRIGEAVKFIIGGGMKGLKGQLSNIASQLERLVAETEKVVAEVEVTDSVTPKSSQAFAGDAA